MAFAYLLSPSKYSCTIPQRTIAQATKNCGLQSLCQKFVILWRVLTHFGSFEVPKVGMCWDPFHVLRTLSRLYKTRLSLPTMTPDYEALHGDMTSHRERTHRFNDPPDVRKGTHRISGGPLRLLSEVTDDATLANWRRIQFMAKERTSVRMQAQIKVECAPLTGEKS